MKPYLGVVLVFAFQCLLVADLSSATTLRVGNCGPKYNYEHCPEGECCSKWGGCGINDPAYCGDGCQPEYGRCWGTPPPPPPPSPPPPPATPPPPHPPGNCGPKYWDDHCPKGECCSEWGGCGFNDPAYCGDGCQPDYGICWGTPPTPAPESSDQLDAVDDSHSLIRKAFDSLAVLNPF